MASFSLRNHFTRRICQGNEFIGDSPFYALLKTANRKQILGRSQVVRHRSLEPAFVGSNPPAPANFVTLKRYEHYRRHQDLFWKCEPQVGGRDLSPPDVRHGESVPGAFL